LPAKSFRCFGFKITCKLAFLNILYAGMILPSNLPHLRNALVKTGIIKYVDWPNNIVTADLRRKLPYEDQSVSAIYASHVIEHLTTSEATRLLDDCFRVLKLGGTIRIIVPDLYAQVKEYIARREANSHSDPAAADDFVRSLFIFNTYEDVNILLRLYRIFTGFERHKWLYDEVSLKKLLQERGFAEIKRRGYLDSSINLIKDVEIEDRFNGAVCVEAIKSQNPGVL
jgi:predicted SAM-dependent methyltransferase